MQKLGLTQSLQQKLSPQQIQFIKLLQIPTAELEARIEEELENNPILEEGREEAFDDYGSEDESYDDPEDSFDDGMNDDLNVDDYLRNEDEASYKTQGDNGGDDEERTLPIATISTLTDSLLAQLDFEKLTEKEKIIGRQIIGSIDEDGYIRRDLEAIVNDLAFSQNIETEYEEVEKILHIIQTFDPPGIGARELQECLLLQLDRKEHDNKIVTLAIRIVDDFFDEFTKKHYEKIQKRLDVSDEDIKDAIRLITRLNPKPGGSASGDVRTQYLIPDFLLTNNSGRLELTLNSRNAPELRISRSYADMLDTYDKSDKKDKSIRETVSFVKQKLDAAKWFIDAIKQRQQTLLRTMNAIVQFQYDFFLEGDESELRPMILKDIAQAIDMDISTVSRVANSKAVQTEFGIFPLKYFFSEGIATETGEDVSSREVKSILKEFIDNEDKRNPLSDDKLEKMLNDKGYNIARRTVAKYREQLNLPVARLRKEL
ncbi:RNA polymerase factor sigma-54 [Cytophagaceae bacterium DM2B3-1]|uniref:RNA polymerase factor sigma-54 n=1 Tax=Xanthocytophaga flava TaxID=3048013 RepID=A0AAE3QM92_9BACT|nr:RNA polymerase factor sigma-54 [Xanthocytophaga flavus]MDJ1470162.1 RNA polymerase factor sigma-54 [Xanthocytophaga flavus]MDJ1481266.1 RNA polymerase factor sigma-54 [Xanthocytophaga flavus]MDJ1495876.1 RNA polymerase factor sigma-54 [Xanthocytophaga flavus]